MCVCVREGERGRDDEREIDRQTDRERERERERAHLGIEDRLIKIS